MYTFFRNVLPLSKTKNRKNDLNDKNTNLKIKFFVTELEVGLRRLRFIIS